MASLGEINITAAASTTLTPTLQTPAGEAAVATTTSAITATVAAITSVGNLIDLSPDDYFRLYEEADDDDGGTGFGGYAIAGDEAAGNVIVGVWNPELLSGNQTTLMLANNSSNNNNSLNLTSMNTWSSSEVATDEQTIATTTPVSLYELLVSSSSQNPLEDDSWSGGGVGGNDSNGHHHPTSHNNNYGRNEEGGNADIALIDSSESELDVDTDYGAPVGFNGAGATGAAGNADATDYVEQSIAYDNILEQLGHNETFRQSFDGGGGASAGGSAVVNVDKSETSDGGSSFMLRLEDLSEYFYNYNNSTSSTAVSGTTILTSNTNVTDFDNHITNCSAIAATINGTNLTSGLISCSDLAVVDHNYWALILILFPILTLFGNILVIMSVVRERSLQTVTNYFIVSLAIADLLVAVVVMPFAVYVLFNGIWTLPNVVCDFYIAMDVICSTSSIFNLVAISIDRYIAVTQPIKYAKHKNSRRVCLTILLVWMISAAIGSPIVLGLNNTPNRDPTLCVFNNADFIVYSSLSSFYIPCIIMVFLYWNIFKALRSRARKQRAARKPHLSELTGGSVIENIAQTRRLAETALDSSRHTAGSRIVPDEPATNTGSGSQEEDEENAISPDIDDCHVIVNDKSTEFMLATVVEETGNVVAQITTQPQLIVGDPNGNHDSGYAPSNVDDVLAGAAVDSTPPDSPDRPSGTTLKRALSAASSRRNTAEGSPKREPALSVAMKPLSFVRYGVQEAMTLARNDSTLSTTSKTSSRKDKKNSQASRFTIYKVHKASKKKREKSSAKKERKATKTLAIVLGVFLFCWVPFFTCNIMDAMCSKFDKDCQPGVTAFILTTWLGYINSFVNPVIYTIFNPEFRKAFKKIMHMG